MKYVHWMDLVIGALFWVMLVNLLSGIGIDIDWPVAQTVFLVIIGLFILFVIYWYGIRRKRMEIQVDERVRANTDKSARNGFIATWLAMFIFVDFEAPDADSLLIVIASGLAVLIVSSFIYYFKGN